MITTKEIPILDDTNDTVLLFMVEAGSTTQEISGFFGVSVGAVERRLERIAQP